MKPTYSLAYYLEDLWSKGFKLSDEDVHFVYFGKNSTNTEDWKVILALQMTLKFQKKFDPSFYISLLEHIADRSIISKKSAYQSLEERGLSNMETKKRTSS
ncbi:hypothetical protein GCM10010954_05290 [Halobacillus andaensis]|uniref:Uncharacterized protein n=1 Tax=Halobacillus andaensis TaxID=1176239 RepID=A0A917AZL9_HALAA|nr:DUF6123 family protein [Halobacillus andaensis]MBP2003318.1 hypothetical protein [Halobacillus andaensis]GGF09755.1 hypothetical protein GCM10010954_05290 [Halobacillus andaensis]